MRWDIRYLSAGAYEGEHPFPANARGEHIKRMHAWDFRSWTPLMALAAAGFWAALRKSERHMNV
jgi:hypothetical protein